LTIHQRRIVDIASLVPDEIDAALLVLVEISRPTVVPSGAADDVEDDDAIPNVLPFPAGRSGKLASGRA
jgi:hypothetical protein